MTCSVLHTPATVSCCACTPTMMLCLYPYYHAVPVPLYYHAVPVPLYYHAMPVQDCFCWDGLCLYPYYHAVPVPLLSCCACTPNIMLFLYPYTIMLCLFRTVSAGMACACTPTIMLCLYPYYHAVPVPLISCCSCTPILSCCACSGLFLLGWPVPVPLLSPLHSTSAASHTGELTPIYFSQ